MITHPRCFVNRTHWLVFMQIMGKRSRRSKTRRNVDRVSIDANGASRCGANNHIDVSSGSVWLKNIAESMLESGAEWHLSTTNKEESYYEPYTLESYEGELPSPSRYPNKPEALIEKMTSNITGGNIDVVDGVWLCPRCTFRNEKGHLQCNVCLAVRGEMDDSFWDDSPASKKVVEFVSLSDIRKLLREAKPQLSADLIQLICEMMVPPAVDESKYPTKPTF
jgi:ubiquitin-protein ligase